jgi:hypothetical protein
MCGTHGEDCVPGALGLDVPSLLGRHGVDPELVWLGQVRQVPRPQHLGAVVELVGVGPVVLGAGKGWCGQEGAGGRHRGGEWSTHHQVEREVLWWDEAVLLCANVPGAARQAQNLRLLPFRDLDGGQVQTTVGASS